MMNCKKCNADLTGKEYKTVAQWNFCLDCFNELISQGEKEKNAKPEAVEPDRNIKSRYCSICEKELAENEGRNLLGSLFCEQCYENLVKRAPDSQPASNEESVADDNSKKGVAQVSVDFISQAKCYQCGKTIRIIASREYKGHLYCPDCYFNIPEIKSPRPQAFVDVALQMEPHRKATENPAAESARVCQACQRRISPENSKIIEGFEICLACLAADSDTALEIARLRHRRRLEEIKKELS